MAALIIIIIALATLYIGGMLKTDARMFEERAANDALLAEWEAMPGYDVVELEVEHIELTTP